MIHHIRDMIGSSGALTSFPHALRKKTYWVRSVPEPFYGGLFDRARDAWSVLCGYSYAVRWPVPGELEDALQEPLLTRTPEGMVRTDETF